MNNRFKFNAIVSSYYDIDTPENYEEFEPRFYLKNVDVFCTGEIGIDYDVLFEAVKEQSKNLTKKEIGQIMKNFEDNSNSPECDFVTIKPDKILQCTGKRDCDGSLIYENDIVRLSAKNGMKFDYLVVYKNYQYILEYINGKLKGTKARDFYKEYAQTRSLYEHGYKVIGNIYQDKDLLNA